MRMPHTVYMSQNACHSVLLHQACMHSAAQITHLAENTERLTAYQRRRMKEVAESNMAMPHSHAMTPARLFTPLLGQSNTSSTQLSHHQHSVSHTMYMHANVYAWRMFMPGTRHCILILRSACFSITASDMQQWIKRCYCMHLSNTSSLAMAFVSQHAAMMLPYLTVYAGAKLS